MIGIIVNEIREFFVGQYFCAGFFLNLLLMKFEISIFLFRLLLGLSK